MSINEPAIGAQMGILYRCVIACPRRRQKQVPRTHMLARATVSGVDVARKEGRTATEVCVNYERISRISKRRSI